MDLVLRQAEEISLTEDDLRKIANDKVKIIRYVDLENIKNIDELLNPYGAVIILYQTELNYGHWCSLMRMSENRLEFFDSYGVDIDKELKYSAFHLQRHEGNIVPHLSALIDKSNYSYYYNSYELQKIKKDVNTCGRYTALRVKMKDIPLNDFVKLLTENKAYDSDFWVSALTFMDLYELDNEGQLIKDILE